MCQSLKLKLHGMTILLLIAAIPFPAQSQKADNSCPPKHLKSAVVQKVTDTGNLHLAHGETVRLIGVMPLKVVENAKSQGAKWFNRLAQEALAVLRRQTEGKTVELHQSGRTRDRYDRLLAHVYTPDRQWVQGLLLQNGLAHSYSYRDNRACIKEMLALEERARTEARGLWRAHTFRPVEAGQTRRLLRRRYRLTLVEGRVRTVAMVKGWVFVNFGENWRDDFTIAIKRKYRKKILPGGVDLTQTEGRNQLEGRRVRVRGWIERWNGPLIKVTHAEQIEFLDEE
jgi:endonuclease YncB( thermonuclease family)